MRSCMFRPPWLEIGERRNGKIANVDCSHAVYRIRARYSIPVAHSCVRNSGIEISTNAGVVSKENNNIIITAISAETRSLSRGTV